MDERREYRISLDPRDDGDFISDLIKTASAMRNDLEQGFTFMSAEPFPGGPLVITMMKDGE